MGRRRFTRRIAGEAQDMFDPAFWWAYANPAGYSVGDRVAIISAAELRYLDVCRRHFEAMRKAPTTKGKRP